MPKYNKFLAAMLSLAIGGSVCTPVNAWKEFTSKKSPVESPVEYIFRSDQDDDTIYSLVIDLANAIGYKGDLSPLTGAICRCLGYDEDHQFSSGSMLVFVLKFGKGETTLERIEEFGKPTVGGSCQTSFPMLTQADDVTVAADVSQDAGLAPSAAETAKGETVAAPVGEALLSVTAPVPDPQADQKSQDTTQSKMLAPEAKVQPATSVKPERKPVFKKTTARAKVAARTPRAALATKRPRPEALVDLMSSPNWRPCEREKVVLQICPKFDQLSSSPLNTLYADCVLRPPYKVICLDPTLLLRLIEARRNILDDFGCIIIGGTDAAYAGLKLLDGRATQALCRFNTNGGVVIFLHEALRGNKAGENFTRKLKVQGGLEPKHDPTTRYCLVQLDLPDGHPLLTTPNKLNPIISVKRTHAGIQVAETDRNLVVGHGMDRAPEDDRYLMISEDKSVAMIEAAHNPDGQATPEEANLLNNLIHYCINAQERKAAQEAAPAPEAAPEQEPALAQGEEAQFES